MDYAKALVTANANSKNDLLAYLSSEKLITNADVVRAARYDSSL